MMARLWERSQELAARLTLNVAGLSDEKLQGDHFNATADGRFGKRQLQGTNRGAIRFYGIYPGESVEFSINHPKFEKAEGSEDKLKGDEMRYVDIVLEPKG